MNKKILPKAFFGFCVGVTTGVFVTILMTYLLGQGEFRGAIPQIEAMMATERSAVLLQTIWCGLIGVTFAEASLVFESERWSRPIQYLIHFLVTGAVYLPFLTICYWPVKLGTVLFLLMNILLTYGITYFVQYILDRKTVAEINAELERRYHEQH